MSTPPPANGNDPFSLPSCVLDNTSESGLSDAPTKTELPGPTFTATKRKQFRRCGRSANKRQRSTSDSEDESPTKKFRLSPSPEDATDGEENGASGVDHQDSGHERANRPEPSKFERLPNELLNKLAVYVAADLDLASLVVACRTFAAALDHESADVWRERFLATFDQPLVSKPSEFCWAYKERTFVLRNFVDFSRDHDARLKIQMRVLEEMVLETYHVPGKVKGVRRAEQMSKDSLISRNLVPLSYPREAPWMHTFLSASFYGQDVQKYSRSRMLFDSLQLTFSYLLLSPISEMALRVNHERDRYSIAQVYNWNRELTTLFTKLPESEQPSDVTAQGMTVKSKSCRLSWRYYKLDMNTLYHIRNFWHRHLLDNSHAFLQGAGFGENTYAAMARGLAELGHTPDRWTARLQSRLSTMDLLLKGKWYGHYSCLHRPWPKTLKDLDDRQSCAEDWAAIDPLTLDFSTINEDRGAWPDIFGEIPALEESKPPLSPSTTIYLRGIAPFLDILSGRSTSERRELPNEPSTKYPGYKALRLRGIIHVLPSHRLEDESATYGVKPELPIPGFSRIVFMLYKPATRYLVQVLEHAMGDFGSPWTMSVSQQLTSQQVVVTVPAASGTGEQTGNNNGTGETTITTTSVNMQSIVDGAVLAHDPVQAEKILKEHLDKLLDGEHEEDAFNDDGSRKLVQNENGIWDYTTEKVKNFPREKMIRDNINRMEEAYMPGKDLPWDDIEYAYCYEGIITPGGKVMLGRWWRVGLAGLGVNEGYEVDAEGLGVKIVNGVPMVRDESVNEEEEVLNEADGEGEGGGRWRRSKGMERGPFCFWT